jgi:hypothetical protein
MRVQTVRPLCGLRLGTEDGLDQCIAPAASWVILQSLSPAGPRFFLVSAHTCRISAVAGALTESERAPFPFNEVAGSALRKAKRAWRRAGISMKHFGEMLPSMKTRALGDLDERQTAFGEHEPCEFQSFGRHVEVRRVTCCLLQSPREMRWTHVHQSGELLDLNGLGNVLVNEQFDERQLLRRQRGARVVRVRTPAVVAHKMQCEDVQAGGEPSQSLRMVTISPHYTKK